LALMTVKSLSASHWPRLSEPMLIAA